jgi:CRISPR-associated endonuclease/helicase Cas3
VQAVYGDDELPEGISAAALAYIDGEALGDHIGKEQSEEQFAISAAIDVRAEPEDAYTGKRRGDEDATGLGVDAKTRLGEESVTVVPVHIDGGLWRLSPDGEPFDPAVKPGHALARQLLARQVRLSRKALVNAMKASEVPAGFTEHPWLRDVKPLRLTAGIMPVSNKLQVRLDPVLGIVYRSADDNKPEEACQ